MADEQHERNPADLLEYRIRQLEVLEAAIRVQVERLRQELQEQLRRDYLTMPEMRNTFVSRTELELAATRRREWPLVLFGGVVALCSVASVIIAAIGGIH